MSGTRQRITLQPAFLLHHHPYRDTSRLLELLTREHGRVGVVARGARSPRSGFRGVLQPFRPLLVSWSQRGELGTLTGAELASPGVQLPAARLYSAWYLNELLLRLTRRHDAHIALFDDYAAALTGLGECAAEAAVLRVFEKRLLEALGYGLELRQTLSGSAISPDRHYEYRLEQGVVDAPADASAGLVFAGASLLALAEEQLDGHAMRDARRLLHAALEVYLGPRPLKVREVRHAVYRQTP